MNAIDELFSGGAPTRVHPKVRAWVDRRDRQTDPRFELEFRRVRDGLGFSPAWLYVRQLDDAHKIIWDSDAQWEQVLDSDLISHRFRAFNPENEIERFGYALKAEFAPTENRFGDGYFSAVLIEMLRELGFQSQAGTKEKLDQIRENAPSRNSNGYRDCREMTKAVIEWVAFNLTNQLDYEVAEAKSILAGSLAYYLDERYSLTSRRLLGFG